MMKIWLLVCFLITVVLAKKRNEDKDTTCVKIEGRCVDADARCSDVLPGICPNQEICCAKGKGGERLRVLHKKKAAGAAGEPDGARVNHAGRRPSWRTPQHNTRNLANVKGKSRDRDGKELRNRAASKTGKNKNKRLRNEEIDKLEGKQINAGKKHGGSLRKTARGQKPDPSQKSVHGGRSKMTKQKNRDEGRKKQRKEGNMKTPKVTKTKTESKKKQEPSDAREDTVDEKIAGCRPRSRCRNNGGICKNKCSKKEKEINKGCKGRRCKCCVLKGCKTKAACVNQGGICTKERECLSNNFANTGCRSGCVCCLPPPQSTTTTTQSTTTTTQSTTTTTQSTTTTTQSTTTTTQSTTTTTQSTTTTTQSTTTTTPSTTTTTHSTTTTTSSTTTSCTSTRLYCPNCGVTNITVPSSRIINGTNALTGEFPYQVYITTTTVAESLGCGGSIIKKRWILTAAHCFFDEFGNRATSGTVGYGSIDRTNQITVPMSSFIIHENYINTTLGNDIALVQLAEDLPFDTNPNVQPICLALQSDVPFGGTVVASGWGTLAFGLNLFPTILQKVQLNLITMAQCEALDTLPPDPNTVICTLTPYKDTCQGDSGGPLVAQVCSGHWVQVGIVSYGVECALPDNPGVYTRVPAYTDWITLHTGSSSC